MLSVQVYTTFTFRAMNGGIRFLVSQLSSRFAMQIVTLALSVLRLHHGNDTDCVDRRRCLQLVFGRIRESRAASEY